MAQLKLINLSKKFGQTIAVQNITLTIQDGEFLTLLGPSGCGKTTTLRMIAGFAQPTSGAIELDGQVITSAKKNIFLPPEKRNMGMVFQSFNLIPPYVKTFPRRSCKHLKSWCGTSLNHPIIENTWLL